MQGGRVKREGKRYVPRYVGLLRSGELKKRADKLVDMLTACTICPHHCKVNRYVEKTGRCLSGSEPIVDSFGPHHGEEAPLSGRCGSGTIFFGRCNLRCVFCQNHSISQPPPEHRQHTMEIPELVSVMLSLQDLGCHNINFVSPTHFVPQIVRGICQAAEEGLSIPLVYNTNGYDSVETLRLLDGIMDIYLPDIKYADDGNAYKYSGIKEYTRHSRSAVAEMHRQVGKDQVIADDGIMYRGLIIRHLVLPNNLAGSRETLHWIAEHLGRDVYVSVMSQYHLANRAHEHAELNRGISRKEYREVMDTVNELQLSNALVQGEPFYRLSY